MVAAIADYRKIGIVLRSETDGGKCLGVARATAREHGCDSLSFELNQASFGGGSSERGGAIGSRRFAEKLTMGEIAKIEIGVATAAGNNVGTRDDRLGFQCFERSGGSGFRLDDGSYGGFEIHGDYRNQDAVDGFDGEDAAVMTGEFAGDGESEFGEGMFAIGGADFGGVDLFAIDGGIVSDFDGVARSAKMKGGRMRVGIQIEGFGGSGDDE